MTYLSCVNLAWFADDHEKIQKILFVAVDKTGLVFATDKYSPSVLYYRLSGLLRKVKFLGSREEILVGYPIKIMRKVLHQLGNL